MGASLEWSARTRPQAQQPWRGTACVIEANEAARSKLASALRAMGYATHETGSGIVGAFMADQLNAQAALINVALPDANGLDLIRRMRARRRRAVIIALTPEGRFGFGDVLVRFAGADFSMPEAAPAERLCAAVVEAQGIMPKSNLVAHGERSLRFGKRAF
jgi:DNA-binding response OmpR family regulator